MDESEVNRGNGQAREQSPASLKNVGQAERYGSVLGGLALLAGALARRGVGGVLMGAFGALLLERGLTGECSLYRSLGVSGVQPSERPGVPDNVGINLEQSIVINRSREELFAFWRHLPNLAEVLRHVERVDVLDDRRSHWVVQTPRGRRLEWDALIINEHPNELIAWESLPGASVANAGSVRFEPEPHGNGTVITVKLEYNPPGGLLGWLGGNLIGERAEREIAEDLAQLKQKMEAAQPA